MAIPDGLITGGDARNIDGGAFPATPNDPFWLLFWPDFNGSWHVETEGLDGPTWLPTIQRDWQSPGVNGYRLATKNAPRSRAYALAHTSRRERGAIVIPHNAEVGGDVGYLVAWDAECPRTGRTGKYHTDRWSKRVRPLPGRRPKLPFDRGAYNRWRLALVIEGMIPPPSQAVLNSLINHTRNARDRIEAQSTMPDRARNRKLAEAENRLEMVEGAWIPQPGSVSPWVAEPEPEPAPKKAAPKKTAAKKAAPKKTANRAKKPTTRAARTSTAAAVTSTGGADVR